MESRITHRPSERALVLFGAALSGARQEAGLSHRKIAEAMGVSARCVHNWIPVSGHPVKALPNLLLFSSLCRVLAADPVELLHILERGETP